MHSKLEEIIRNKKQELKGQHNAPSIISEKVGIRQNGSPIKSGMTRKRNDKFIVAITKVKQTAIIAEIKFASPSNGALGLKKDFVKKIESYKKAQVDAISVITEKKFFQGDPKLVRIVKNMTELPVLQKDFVINPYQVYEAGTLGSDALLLIARIVSLNKLQAFVELCFAEGIEPVVEINSEEDLQKALQTGTRIIAVNARDLDTFTIDIKNACRLLKKIPAKYFRLGFSGVTSNKEFQQYIQAGAQGILIGTSLMRKEDPNEFISSLKTN